MPYTHVYSHDRGYGQQAAERAGREHSAEMRDLDLAPGTPVEVTGTHEVNGHVIVAWTDQSGTARNTAIDPDFFDQHFTVKEN